MVILVCSCGHPRVSAEVSFFLGVVRCLPGVGAVSVTATAPKDLGSLLTLPEVYKNVTDSGNKDLESGKKRHTAEVLVPDSVAGHTGVQRGAAGTPVFTGTSMVGGGESVNRSHVMPNNRRSDSWVG